MSPALSFALSISVCDCSLPCSSLFIITDTIASSIALFVLLSISDVTSVTPCDSFVSVLLMSVICILKKLKVSVNSLPTNAAIRHTTTNIQKCFFNVLLVAFASSFLVIIFFLPVCLVFKVLNSIPNVPPSFQ